MQRVTNRLILGVSALLGLAAGSIAQAVDREWSGMTSGTQAFGVADNWSPSGVPGAGDLAIFTGSNSLIPNGANFTVQLASNQTFDNLLARDGQFTVSLDLNGQTLTSSTGNPLIEGSGAGVVLNVGGGGTAAWREFRIGNTANTTGTLNLKNARLSGSGGSSQFFVGGSGTGFFSMSDGAVFANGGRTVAVGANNGSQGTWSLTGTNTAMTTSGHIWIGDFGSASLVIEKGASVSLNHSGNSVAFGHRGGATQVVTALITGPDSLLSSTTGRSDRGITLGGAQRGGTLWSSGTTHVTVADHGRIFTNRLILTASTARLTIDNGTAVAGEDLEALSGSSYEFVLYGADRSALMQIGRDVNLAANVGLTLALGVGASFSPDQFVKLISYGRALNGTFASFIEGQEFSLQVPNDGPEYQFRFTYAGGENNDMIGLVVVPEPGGVALILIGLGGLAISGRRGIWPRRAAAGRVPAPGLEAADRPPAETG